MSSYLVKAVMLFPHGCVNQNTALKSLDKVSKRCYFINNNGTIQFLAGTVEPALIM
jgi:hypothetical protein